MLCNSRSNNVSPPISQFAQQGRAWLDMTPPPRPIALASVFQPFRKDALLDVFKGLLEERRLAFRHFPSEIDDPFVGGAAGGVLAVLPPPQGLRLAADG